MASAAPVYGDKRVGTNPLSAPLANPGIASADAFGAPIAQGAQSGLNAAFQGQAMRDRAAANAQQERDDFEVLDADNQLVDASNDLRAKALQAQGKNAIGLTDRTRADFDKLVAEKQKTLTTPQAKEMFAQRAAQRWNALDSAVVGHSENEITKYKEATLQGAIDREGMEAIESMDPARIADAERKRFVARQALSTMQGVDLDVEHAKDASNLYAQATERFIAAKDWRGAQAFYEANKGKILPSVRDKVLEPALREGAMQSAVEVATAEIAMPRDGVIPTRTQAMSAASKIQDPEVKKRTIDSIKALYVEREQAHEADQQESYNALHKVLRENGGDVNALDPVAVSQLDAKWWKTLESDAKGFVGEAMPTKKTYENIAATDDIRKAIDRGYLDGKDGARIEVTESVVRQLAANKGLTSEQAESVSNYKKQGGVKGALTITQVEKTYEYVTGGRKYDDDRKKYPNLFEQVRDSLVPGKEISQEELRRIMSPIIAEGEIDGSGFFSDSATYGEAVAQGKGEQWLPTVDSANEKAIAGFLKEQVKVANVTPEVVRRFSKYQIQGYPTPLRDGRPMSVMEAVLAGTIQGNQRDLPAAQTARAPRAPGSPASAYDDTGSVRFTSED
jgi:hypothetical protein